MDKSDNNENEVLDPQPGTSSSSQETPQSNSTAFFVNSSAFEDGERIPSKYCTEGVEGGENISIPVSWAGIPEGTESLFLVIVDPHPVAQNWIHWVVKDIPISTTKLDEGASNTSMPGGVTELSGTEGTQSYRGPEPPPDTGDHPYEIHLFALSADKVEITNNPTWEQIESTLEPLIVEQTKYTGYFGR